MKSLRILLIFVCLVFVSTLAHGDSRFYVFGKASFFSSSGSIDDYEVGVNEFPLVSSYQNYGVGFGLTFGKTLFAGIEGHYNFSGKVTLTDPVDPDTVEVNTYKYASGIFTLGVNFVRSQSIRLYINGGGGFRYTLESEPMSYISEQGIDVRVDPPEKKFLLEAFGGLGIEVYFSKSTGVLLNGRYSFVNAEDPQYSFVVLAGVIHRF
jgi:hypothetical protein